MFSLLPNIRSFFILYFKFPYFLISQLTSIICDMWPCLWKSSLSFFSSIVVQQNINYFLVDTWCQRSQNLGAWKVNSEFLRCQGHLNRLLEMTLHFLDHGVLVALEPANWLYPPVWLLEDLGVASMEKLIW